MKRWTNGLPGATKRLGAIMALRGLSASQPRMRADTHDGPEQIAPLQRPDTLMQLSRSSILEVHLVPHGRAIHFGTKPTYRDDLLFVCFWGKADVGCEPAPMVLAASDPKRTIGRIKIPQCSGLLRYRGVLSFRWEAREASGK